MASKYYKVAIASFFVFLLVLSLDFWIFIQYNEFFLSKTHMIDTATFYYKLDSLETNEWIEGVSKTPTESKLKFKERSIFLVEEGYFVRPLKFGYAFSEDERILDEFVNKTYSRTLILGLMKNSNETILLINYTAPLSEYTHNSSTWPKFIINSSDIVLLEIHNYLYTSADSRIISVLFFKNPLFITFGVYQNFTKATAFHKAVQYSINYCTSLSCLILQIAGTISLLYVYSFAIGMQMARRKDKSV